MLGLTSWLAKHPEGDPQNTFQSSRVRLPEACLARAVSLSWLQAAHGEAAEIKCWQEAEVNAPLALRCLFGAVHGGFLHDKERRLSIQVVSNYTAKAGRTEIFLSEIHTHV